MAATIIQSCQGCGARSRAGAEKLNSHSQLRTNMPSFSLANPGFVTIHEEGMLRSTETYGIGILGDRRILHTAEFFQTGVEREELGTRKWVSWDVAVPEGARLFAATGGMAAARTHQFWVGWVVGRRLHMQALMQEKPVETDLATDELPIFPAITDGAGVAALYTWRPAAGAGAGAGAGNGTALWRHGFSGHIKTVGSTAVEALSEIPGRPLSSVATAIPGEPSQHALIGWIEATSEGAILGIAIVMPNRMRVVRSEPLRDLVPCASQRLGIWAAMPASSGRFQLAAAVQSRAEPPKYTVVVFDVASNSDKGATTLSDSGIPVGTLHAAAFDYERNHVEPFFNRAFLTRDGQLWAGKSPPRVKRRAVDLDSPLPIVATSYTYWGTRAPDGTLSFEQL